MSFKDDVEFLKKHTKILLLQDSSKNKMVAVSPAWQGRVMTSTSDGFDGISYGWINRKLIASNTLQEHINVFGGEDRFWLGPEGGQFSIYFEPGTEFNLDNWYVPPSIDTEPFQTLKVEKEKAVFGREIKLKNYSGYQFRISVTREIILKSAHDFLNEMGIDFNDDLKTVAFSSINKIKNIGKTPWEKKSGLLSIWILGMFNPSPQTVVLMPFIQGPERTHGSIVNDAYFGKIPSDRLKAKEGLLFFKADGNMRGKIGLSPFRSKSFIGSYDAENGILTIVLYSTSDIKDYVNSMWEIQEEPYNGDVLNAYNDGPPEPGVPPLGPFYELETSSPAVELQPGESLEHTHTTIHIQGDESLLSELMKSSFGITTEDAFTVFKKVE